MSLKKGFLTMQVPSWLLAPAFALVRMRVRALANFDTEVDRLKSTSKSS